MRGLETSDFRAQIPTALEALDLEINPATLDLQMPNMYYRRSTAVAETADGLKVLSIEPDINDYYAEDAPESFVNVGRPETAWGGLINHTRNKVTIDYAPYPDSKYKSAATLVINVITSPEGYNTAQTKLGRQPGTDAFNFTYTHDTHPLEGGHYVEFFANKAAPVGKLVAADWYHTEHDLTPFFHATSWVCSEPKLVNGMADRGSDILDTHGELAYTKDAAERPAEIGKFIRGADDLFVPLNSLLRLVYDAGNEIRYNARTSNYHTLPITLLHGIVDGKLRVKAAKNSYYILDASLHRMGLIDLVKDTDDAYRKSAEITARTISFIAGLLLISGELSPPETETMQLKNRQDRLHLIRKQFMTKAVDIASYAR